MVVFTIGNWTEFITELTMSIIGNTSLQHADRAMILASIVDRDVLICSFDCHKTGQLCKSDDKPSLTHGAGRICFVLHDHTFWRNLHSDRNQSYTDCSKGSLPFLDITGLLQIMTYAFQSQLVQMFRAEHITSTIIESKSDARTSMSRQIQKALAKWLVNTLLISHKFYKELPQELGY